MKKEKQKILVGMSGGVDSAVTALLLQKEGYEVEGIFLDFIDGEKSERDFQSAQKIAKKLNIPIYKIDARGIFKKEIIDKFVADYKKGVTPNPCVMCNPQMKFKILLKEANERGINFVATGHYARLGQEFPILPTGRQVSNFQFPNKSQFPISKINKNLQATSYNLLTARDSDKDQSYFLYRLTEVQLARIIFPLGDYLKSEVREIAKENGFGIKNEEESQDVCFIADNDFNKFISEKIANKPGKIVDNSRKVLGKHKGLHFYTIGQRKGINLGGDGPYFVVKKDLANNQLVVANKLVENLWRDEFEIKNANWIDFGLTFPLEASVKIRYRTEEICAIIEEIRMTKDGADKIYRVKLDQPQKAITSGQSAVFYSKESAVLGGGIII